MGPLSLRARLLLALAYVLLLAIVSLLVPLLSSVRTRVDDEVRSQALAQAQLVAASVPGLPARALEPLAQAAAATVRGRVIVLDRLGRVRVDSATAVTRGASYANRPEVRGALRGRPVQAQRHSGSLHEAILATAVPVLAAGRPDGAVRITQSVAAVHRAVAASELGLGLIGLLVLVLGLGAGAVVAQQLTRPLHRLAGAARAVEAGDLTVRASEEGSSEQRALARAFNDMTGQIRRLLDAQREFVADASHQLRTPLAGLRLRLEEALAAGGGAATRTQLVGALGEVDRLAAIVSELLVLSRAGEVPPAAERISLARAARDAAARWAPAAEAHRTAVRVTAPAAGAAVRCTRADLDRILDVLLENALAYGPDGGSLRVAADGTRLEVRDDGPGPTAGEEEAVFARFHRGTSGRDGPRGTGLGLAIARELARALGCHRDARPRIGRRRRRRDAHLPGGGTLMRRIPSPLRWALAALAGLVLAAAITTAASRLSSQHIGLSSEPLTAGQQLVALPPRQVPRPRPTARPSRTPSPSPVPSITATATPVAPPPATGGNGEGGDD